MALIISENTAAIRMVEYHVVHETVPLGRHVVRHQSIRTVVVHQVVANRVVARSHCRLADINRKLDPRVRRSVALVPLHNIVA